MVRKISNKEAGKIQKAKDAYAKENYKRGQYSDKTFSIAKKQGVVKDKTQLASTRSPKEAKMVRTIQVNRKNDLSRTAGRAQMIESRARSMKKATVSKRKSM